MAMMSLDSSSAFIWSFLLLPYDWTIRGSTITINDGAAYTNTTAVSLSISSSANRIDVYNSGFSGPSSYTPPSQASILVSFIWRRRKDSFLSLITIHIHILVACLDGVRAGLMRAPLAIQSSLTPLPLLRQPLQEHILWYVVKYILL